MKPTEPQRTFTQEQSQAMYDLYNNILLVVPERNPNAYPPDSAEYRNADHTLWQIGNKIKSMLQAIDSTPATEPAYKQARGITGWQEGDESAEDSIRRLRDGEPAQETGKRYVVIAAHYKILDTVTNNEIGFPLPLEAQQAECDRLNTRDAGE